MEIDARPRELFLARGITSLKEERRDKREKRRKEDGRKMATIKYPDDRPKKNSRRAKSERQKWNISRPFDNLFRAFVYNITKRCRSRKGENAYECEEKESDERMNRVHFSLLFE